MGIDKEFKLSIQNLAADIKTAAKQKNIDLDVAVDNFLAAFNEDSDFNDSPSIFLGGAYYFIHLAEQAEDKFKIMWLVEAAKLFGCIFWHNKSANEVRNIFSAMGKHAADRRHSQPGGSRDKRENIRTIWASGKYSSRDICAEQECAALGMSFSVARKALRNTPAPT